MNIQDILNRIEELNNKFGISEETRAAKQAELEANIKAEQKALDALNEKLSHEENYYDRRDYKFAQQYDDAVKEYAKINSSLTDKKLEKIESEKLQSHYDSLIVNYQNRIADLKKEKDELFIKNKFGHFSNDLIGEYGSIEAVKQHNLETINKNLAEIDGLTTAIAQTREQMAANDETLKSFDGELAELEAQLEEARKNKVFLYEKQENEIHGIPEIDVAQKEADQEQVAVLNNSINFSKDNLALQTFFGELNASAAELKAGNITPEQLAARLEEISVDLPVIYSTNEEARKAALDENALYQTQVKEKIEVLTTRLADDSNYPMDALYTNYLNEQKTAAKNSSASALKHLRVLSEELDSIRAVQRNIDEIKANLKSGNFYASSEEELAALKDQHTYETYFSEIDKMVSDYDSEIARLEQEMSKLESIVDFSTQRSIDIEEQLEKRPDVNLMKKHMDERNLAKAKEELNILMVQETEISDNLSDSIGKLVESIRTKKEEEKAEGLPFDMGPLPEEPKEQTETETITADQVPSFGDDNVSLFGGAPAASNVIDPETGLPIPQSGSVYDDNEATNVAAAPLPGTENIDMSRYSGDVTLNNIKEKENGKENTELAVADENTALIPVVPCRVISTEEAKPGFIARVKDHVNKAKEWLKKNWKKIVLPVAGLAALGMFGKAVYDTWPSKLEKESKEDENLKNDTTIEAQVEAQNTEADEMINQYIPQEAINNTVVGAGLALGGDAVANIGKDADTVDTGKTVKKESTTETVVETPAEVQEEVTPTPAPAPAPSDSGSNYVPTPPQEPLPADIVIEPEGKEPTWSENEKHDADENTNPSDNGQTEQTEEKKEETEVTPDNGEPTWTEDEKHDVDEEELGNEDDHTLPLPTPVPTPEDTMILQPGDVFQGEKSQNVISNNGEANKAFIEQQTGQEVNDITSEVNTQQVGDSLVVDTSKLAAPVETPTPQVDNNEVITANLEYLLMHQDIDAATAYLQSNEQAISQDQELRSSLENVIAKYNQSDTITLNEQAGPTMVR